MGNCLVTKLKGSVDNDNLTVLGSLKFSVDIRDGGHIANFVRSKDNSVEYTVEIISPGVTITSVEGPGAKQIDSKKGIVRYYNDKLYLSGAGSSVNVMISSKYDIDTIQSLSKSNGIEIKLSELKYCKNLTTLDLNSYWNATGDIEELSLCSKLEQANIAWNEGTFGNIEKAFGTLTNLSLIGIANTVSVIDGDLKQFVQAQINAGRTSCNGITFNSMQYVKALTMNGTNINYITGINTNYTLSWSGNKILFKSVTGVSVPRLYCIGYNESEQQGFKSEGYMVFACD